MGLTGADVLAIRNFVQGLNQRSRVIAQVTQDMTNTINALPWAGTDRERFIADWTTVHYPGLLGLLHDLADASGKAAKAATAQEQASAEKADGS